MRIRVFLNCEGKRDEVGILDDSNGIRFQYAPEFLERKISLSPFALPLSTKVWKGKSQLNSGLPGVIADSLPDSWGDLLFDCKLRSAGRQLKEVPLLERLSYVSYNGMGALEYEPELENGLPRIKAIHLDSIAEDVKGVLLETSTEKALDRLCSLAGAAGGSRPKIVCLVSDDGKFRLKPGVLAEKGYSPWLIKFRSLTDAADIGVQEFICSELMRKAAIDVAPTKLFPSKKGKGWFGMKRFDRTKKGKLHMATAAGILDCDYRSPCLDYQTVLALTRALVGPHALIEQIKRAAFSFLIGHCDDHAKNFSFLMNSAGKWSVSPAYDMVSSRGINGEHMTSLMGKGKNLSRRDFLQLGEAFDIASRVVDSALDDVLEALSFYPKMARELDVKVPKDVRFEL